MTIRGVLNEFLPGYTNAEQSLIFVAAIIAFVLITNFIIKRILDKLDRKKVEDNFYYSTIDALKLPIRLSVWVLGFYYICLVGGDFFDLDIRQIASSVRQLFFIWLAAMFLWKLVNQYEVHSKKNPTQINKKVYTNTLCRVAKIVIAVLTLLTAVEAVGIHITGILAFGSVSGIILGFASKDLLANFFGATMIYLDKPFEVGDWIVSPDKDIEGTVAHVSWRLTKIIRFNKRPLYVPNSTFNTISIENASRMTYRRIREIIGVRYEDMNSLRDIINDVKSMLNKHDEIASDQTMIVNLIEFNKSSVDFMVYTFTKTTEWVKFQEVKQDIMLKVSDIIEKHGAQIAFPTTTIHIDNEAMDEIMDAPQPGEKVKGG